MPFCPHTPQETEEMLKVLGLKSLDELFLNIPSCLLLKEDLKIDSGKTETELKEILKRIAKKNTPLSEFDSFLGGGCYQHFVPSALSSLLNRCEFYTSYTPYQAEASQGTLQAIYEYQTFICLLTGMDVTCASLYDGASSLAEAVLMSYRINPRPKIFLASNLNPAYKEVVYTYTQGMDFIEIKEIPFNREGRIDLDALSSMIDDQSCSVAVGYPNFFGVIEELDRIKEILSKKNILMIICCNPLSLAVLKSPGELGADLVCGDGQVLGQGLNFGGPTFGFLATRKEFVRKIPGRLVGRTKDRDGKQGFVLTLQAREQHIRREKATSNICSNQSLNAIACAIFLSLVGPQGLKEMAYYSLNNAHYLKERLSKIDNISFPFSGDFFNEFVISIENKSIDEVLERCLDKKILAGVPLKNWWSGLDRCLLVSCTELNTYKQIDKFAEVLDEILNK
ncbi:MAG: glycine dehydrogenase (aminomethyl-transferring) [Candidatus Omnitrophica bacterium 4484_70.2]|nr:MAG: glycine dehydrogenase (aminomethyl-transferring) [Candidatus Omnitrophica bacterium 4484_70.2]